MNYITRVQYRIVVSLAMVVALSFAVVAPTTAFAQYDGGSGDGSCCDYVDTSWDNGGYVDTSWDSGGYVDTSWDSPYVDTSWDSPYVDTSWDSPYVDTSWNSSPYVDTSWDSPYVDTSWNSSPYVDTSWQNAYADVYTYNYANQQYDNQSAYNYGSSYGTNYLSSLYSGGGSSYTPPRYTPPTTYTPPTYVPPQPQPQYCPAGTTGTYPNCHYPQPVYTNNTSNYCTNGSCNSSYVDNSYVNNSINGSFNTNIANSGNSNYSVTAPVYQVTPQPIVQYQFTQPIVYTTPTYYNQNLYCAISVTGGYGSGMVSLTWTSTGATSAYISPIVGYVNPNGSTSFYANGNNVYSLTVTGPGGTYTCRTQAVASAPYVSLSQIPYTGFDFGPVGNALYWMGLISFAVAAAYLVLYYQGGAFALAGSMLGSVRRVDHVSAAEATIEEAPAPAHVHEEETSPVAALEALPVSDAQPMKDSMFIQRGHDGTPRIVINRA
ncbi:hypothetical protein K8R03_02545 [Candidatus Kaiserbacteria bacterium]|nr:hypothetical protein [Candidatus Kaiserbacteria bacterium]